VVVWQTGLLLVKVVPDRAYVVGHVQLHGVVSSGLDNVGYALRPLEFLQLFGIADLPVRLEKLPLKQPVLVVGFLHLWARESDRDMGLLFFPLDHVVVEEVHCSLHQFCAVAGEFVRQLHHLC